jgi:general secretion pathway protein H
MPTLATGISPIRSRPVRHASAGFTLVEIMVVVFIIGIITAGIVITFAGDNRDTQLDEEAERLDALIAYVREQAELQTRDYGLRMDRLNYGFVVFDPIANQWRNVDEDKALRERPIPEGLIPGLVVEGRTVVLDTRRPTVTDIKPQVLIFGNGDISSFEVSFEREGTGLRARIYSDEDSLVRLSLPNREESVTDATGLAVTR